MRNQTHVNHNSIETNLASDVVRKSPSLSQLVSLSPKFSLNTDLSTKPVLVSIIMASTKLRNDDLLTRTKKEQVH